MLFGMNARCVTLRNLHRRVPEGQATEEIPQDTKRAALCLHLSLRQSVSAAAAPRGTCIKLSPRGFTIVAPTCLTTGDSETVSL